MHGSARAAWLLQEHVYSRTQCARRTRLLSFAKIGNRQAVADRSINTGLNLDLTANPVAQIRCCDSPENSFLQFQSLVGLVNA